MKVVKVRRVGNSNVISLPRELESAGYVPGASVVIDDLGSGELRIMSEANVNKLIRETGRRVVAEHQEALAMLEEYDRMPTPRRTKKRR